MSQYHMSGWPVGMGYVPVPRVRLSYRCGPCPSVTCQTGLSVWAMPQCHVSGRSVGKGHVPLPRVRLSCRCGPCLTTARPGSSALPNKTASLMRHFLYLLFADCLRGADQLRRSAPGHILTIRLHFCIEFYGAIKQSAKPTNNNRAVEESQSTLQFRPRYTVRSPIPQTLPPRCTVYSFI